MDDISTYLIGGIIAFTIGFALPGLTLFMPKNDHKERSKLVARYRAGGLGYDPNIAQWGNGRGIILKQCKCSDCTVRPKGTGYFVPMDIAPGESFSNVNPDDQPEGKVPITG